MVNPAFRTPNAFERLFNQFFGFLVGHGLGFAHHYLLQVHGRKTGKLYSTPVDLLEYKGKQFLVAPRGHTQWVRNAEAAGEVILKKGRLHQNYQLISVPESARPEVLKEYLERFQNEVQRYFPVKAGSPVEAFGRVAASYPIFELTPRNQG